VAALFRDLGVPFEFENDLFRLDAERNPAWEGLRTRLSDAERADIRVSRERGAGLLAAISLDDYVRGLDTAWFDEALRNDAFTNFFQPIVDTRTGAPFAHECLIRLFAGRAYSGGEIIEAAFARGSIHLFDAYARRLSVRKAGAQFIPGAKVFINFMPSSIYDPAYCMASTLEEMSHTMLKPADIVFEVVESDHIRDVKHLQKICDYYRKEGFGFALDDVGTGSSSLQMVCDLQPDYIKLDKSLISEMDAPMYRSMIEKMVEFASESGVAVIGEGVENAQTVEILQSVGIHLMQGWHFGKPAPEMAGDDALGTRLIAEPPATGEEVTGGPVHFDAKALRRRVEYSASLRFASALKLSPSQTWLGRRSGVPSANSATCNPLVIRELGRAPANQWVWECTNRLHSAKR
jgi:EAL domain-containing protein (putative c-di-GMP-specific phosphodiesterase class I)